MSIKRLSIGDIFTAFDDEFKFYLHEVHSSREGVLYAVGIDERGIPWVINETDIDDEKETIEVWLPTPPKKTKGKK